MRTIAVNIIILLFVIFVLIYSLLYFLDSISTFESIATVGSIFRKQKKRNACMTILYFYTFFFEKIITKKNIGKRATCETSATTQGTNRKMQHREYEIS